MSERGDVLSEQARQAPGGARSPLQILAYGWRATLLEVDLAGRHRRHGTVSWRRSASRSASRASAIPT